MHVTDWLPTLINAIGEDPNLILSNNVTILDGLNLWPTLISGGSESPRNEILHNIDDIYGNEAVRYGKWKLLHGKLIIKFNIIISFYKIVESINNICIRNNL